MTYIPAEQDPQGSAAADSARSRAPQRQARTERGASRGTLHRQRPPHGSTAFVDPSAADRARSSEAMSTQVLPTAPRSPSDLTMRSERAPLLPDRAAPLPAPGRPAYPGQAVYHYGGQAERPERDLSAGIVLGQLIRAAVLLVLAAALAWTALRTVNGQWADEMALQQAAALQARLPAAATSLLGGLTVGTAVVCAVLSLIFAASERRWVPLLVAAMTAGAALLTVQVLKHGLLSKVPYGIQDAAQNSLPSGHTAASAAAVAAVLMVAPARWRKPLALLGALVVAAAGIGTVLNGWHRPSDAAVAILVVCAWFVLGTLLLRALVPGERWESQRGLTLLTLAMGSAVLCAVGLTAMQTMPVPGIALATGALGILTISLLASHQLVRAQRPRRR